MATDSLFVLAKHLARLQGQVVAYNTDTCVFELRPAGWEGDGDTGRTARPPVGDRQVLEAGCGQPTIDDPGEPVEDIDRTDTDTGDHGQNRPNGTGEPVRHADDPVHQEA